MRGRTVSWLFSAALTALLAWAILTGSFWDFLADSARFFGIENTVTMSTDGEDVLFDDDSSVDFSDPATDVFDPTLSTDTGSSQKPPSSSESGAGKTYEFAVTPDYFNAWMEKYSNGDLFRNITAAFGDGNVVLTGDVVVARLAEQFEIPSAFVLFLPKTVPCRLTCAPTVEEGRLRVTVTEVWAGNDVLTPFLGNPAVLSKAEDFLNDQLTRHLPSDYMMQSVRVDKTGMFVRFEG